jgi:hypothetical protein
MRGGAGGPPTPTPHSALPGGIRATWRRVHERHPGGGGWRAAPAAPRSGRSSHVPKSPSRARGSGTTGAVPRKSCALSTPPELRPAAQTPASHRASLGGELLNGLPRGAGPGPGRHPRPRRGPAGGCARRAGRAGQAVPEGSLFFPSDKDAPRAVRLEVLSPSPPASLLPSFPIPYPTENKKDKILA